MYRQALRLDPSLDERSMYIEDESEDEYDAEESGDGETLDGEGREAAPRSHARERNEEGGFLVDGREGMHRGQKEDARAQREKNEKREETDKREERGAREEPEAEETGEREKHEGGVCAGPVGGRTADKVETEKGAPVSFGKRGSEASEARLAAGSPALSASREHAAGSGRRQPDRCQRGKKAESPSDPRTSDGRGVERGADPERRGCDRQDVQFLRDGASSRSSSLSTSEDDLSAARRRNEQDAGEDVPWALDSGACSLCSLPPELLDVLPLYLDAFALTRLSSCCRLLQRLCGAKSDACWRAKCVQVFGPSCAAEVRLYNASWHLMYLQRPRIRMDGIYISRCVYMRRVRDVGNLMEEGEQERRQRLRLQQQLKREQELTSASLQLLGTMLHQSPVVAVSYHRYLRFLPLATGNKVLVLRSEADKHIAVQALKNAEQRVREVERRNGGNCHVVFSTLSSQSSAPSQTGQWTWQRLVPFIAVGDYAFDPHTRRVEVCYDEPRTHGANSDFLPTARELRGGGRDPAGRRTSPPRAARVSTGEHFSSSSFPPGLSSVASDSSGVRASLGGDQSRGSAPRESGPEGDWKRRRPYTHRAVFEICGGTAARSNCRLKWISFAVGSALGLHEDDESNDVAHLNIDSEHFRPFLLNRVKAFESHF
uniref:Tetratricopeptide repeat-containing protein n=1 Tax=Neospora caninum (strain Liverpool) TaxID=572307 RepID=A0A0F7UBL2_NEOCL|nr:TPA: tetratricopeptide repeat-containing protein [Neospora caninum Liverpool]